jgi:hypothetical protein
MTDLRERILTAAMRVYQYVAGRFVKIAHRLIRHANNNAPTAPPASAPAMPSAPDPISSIDRLFDTPLPQPSVLLDKRKPKPRRKHLTEQEKARLKLDVFVEPQGPTPLKKPRRERELVQLDPDEAKPPPSLFPIEDHTETFHIADKIDGSGNEDVAIAESEFYGEFNFRDCILHQLERYWVYLRRMKKNDADSYELYKKIGAHIVPPVAHFLENGIYRATPKKRHKDPVLSPWWKTHRPAFSCITYGITKKIEEQELNPPKWKMKEMKGYKLWIPKFFYLVHYSHPPSTIEPTSGGDVYKMTMWWDRPQDKSKLGLKFKGGEQSDIGIWISKDGTQFRALKMRRDWIEHIEPQRKRSKDGRGIKPSYARGPYKKTSVSIKRTGYDWPEGYKDMAARNGETTERYLAGMFADIAQSIEMAELASVVRIEVHNKEGLTAVFGVAVRRMAYFFQDRDITLTKRGYRKPIFHIVKAHARTRNGKVSTVRFHFAGENEFTWAGYDVRVTVPGRDHFHPTEFDIGVSDSEWLEPGKRALTEGQIGGWLADAMHQGAQLRKGEMPPMPKGEVIKDQKHG